MQRNRKLKIIAGLIGVWALWISGIFGNDGVLQAYRLATVRRDLALRIHAEENEQARLKNILSELKSNRFAQEMAIRDTLGYVRDGEVVFELK